MKVFVNGQEVDLEPDGVQVLHLADRLAVRTRSGTATALAVRSGDAILVSYLGMQYRIEAKGPRHVAHRAATGGEIRAPMPGQVVDVLVSDRADVKKGDKLLVLEAMKTQQAFVAPFDGQVLKLGVAAGDQVSDGDLLVLIQAHEKEP